ncbi:MAG: transporter [Alphaproteobacteria bacterium]|nr:transporter [Alphaproteobacteria bacterium]
MKQIKMFYNESKMIESFGELVMSVNLIIVFVYFVITILTGFLFQKISHTSISSFFRGGGNMAWWMVGTTIFIVQFSAVTFTAHAAKAFSDGITILGIFIGNIGGFVASYYYFAHRYRQTRVDTGGEIVRARFGKANEQFFVWMNVPSSLISAGLWLNGLAICVSAVLGWDIPTTILIAGIAVTVLSVMSGAWGIVASDFIQGIIIMLISLILAIVALYHVGGISNMVTHYPGNFILGENMNFPAIVVGSFIFYFLKQNLSINGMMQSYRFLNARDSVSARKGAIMAVILMIFGTFIWFIPAWSAASLIPDAATVYADTMGSRAKEAIYVVFVDKYMPVGTLGLFAVVLFAASVSSMDSAVNTNAGLIMKSFYQPVIRNNKAGGREMLQMSLIISAVMGALTILIGLFYDSMRNLTLFDLFLKVTVLTQMPLQIPQFFGMITKKTPDWSGWGTTLFGFFVSVVITLVIPIKALTGAFGLELTGRELADLDIMYMVAAHVFLTTGFFYFTTLFYKDPQGERKSQLGEFYENLATPVVRINDPEVEKLDVEQRKRVGFLVLLSGFFFFLLVLVPNPMWGKLMFSGSGLLIMLVGWLMFRNRKNNAVKE